MSRPKQLLDWGGRPLLQHVVAAVASWPVGGVTVVLGAHAEEILDRVDFGAALVIDQPGVGGGHRLLAARRPRPAVPRLVG